MGIQQVALTEASYEARSIIADAQRCVNLYPEQNPADSPFPFTFYPTAGLTTLWEPPILGPCRCVYTASNGKLFYVVGKRVYYIAPGWNPLFLGSLLTSYEPVSIKDNGITAILVDGSPNGYLINLETNAFSKYLDPNFLGSTRVDYLDGFFTFNEPNSRAWYTSLFNTTAIDPTYIAAKVGAPDQLSVVACVHREAWLLGLATSEIWANAGDPAFPFEAVPGAFIQHGIAAPFSVASDDVALYWIEQDKNGKGIVVEGAGYNVRRISTPAIEKALASYPTIVDATGFTYQQSGHVFYQLNFPSADKTWVWDKGLQKWHEKSWVDANGEEHRHRANFGAVAYGVNVVGDWENGTLYQLDLDNGTDFGGPIVRRKGFPHLTTSGRLAVYDQFQAEMEVGEIPDALVGEGPLVSFRYSNTRGKSWSTPQSASLGGTGQYATVPQWRQLGLARDMVFELFWSDETVTALNGGYAMVEGLDS